MASQRPGRYLETFLEPVASFSQSMSPWRATATHFRPEITYFGRPKTYMSARIRPRLIGISRNCNFTTCFWRWDSPSTVRVSRNFQNLQFYGVFLKVRLTKCCKGCMEFSEFAIGKFRNFNFTACFWRWNSPSAVRVFKHISEFDSEFSEFASRSGVSNCCSDPTFHTRRRSGCR